MHHKNRVEETRVRISLHPLLTVQTLDLILLSLVSPMASTSVSIGHSGALCECAPPLCGALHDRRAAAMHLSAFRNGTYVKSDFSFPAAHGLEIITTGLIVRQYSL